ncbi:MAG: gluconate 2-dehydrogenase subunit 3 family protein [Reichenbachiella sp.]|uniref:gluconate 2-dehydrogenase subunit 3 family protein n=1 Tax=Reichenbachiella sp. TaxID=2184521 RepID=UPI00326404E4
MMNRREVLKSVGLLVGGAVVGADAFLAGCTFEEKKSGLLALKQISLLEDIAETTLPHTDNSPGAKDAQVGPFINRIVTDFYSQAEQEVLLASLRGYQAMKFTELSAIDKEKHLLSEEARANAYPKAAFVDESGESFETRPGYIMIKQLSIWAYLSSEIVAKSNFNYLPVPGKYESCVEVTDQIKPMYNKPSSRGALRKV